MQSQSHQWKRGEQVQAILDAAKGATPFHAPSGEPFVAIPNGPFSHTTLPLRARQFRLWVQNNFDLEYGAAPSESALRGALNLLEARAIYSGPEMPVGTRVLGDERKITIDLANSDGECVEITSEGWRVTDTVACGFFRAKSSPLPVPVNENTKPGDSTAFDTFRHLVNLNCEANWDAALTWLTNALRPTGPCPILVIDGPQLSGKSTLARLLASLIDPSPAPIASLPPRAEKIPLLAAGRHVLAFDNVGSISPAKAAALSELSETVERSHPIILVRATGDATPLPDNIARHSITVTLEAPANLRTFYDLQREFEDARPRVLGALYTAVGNALQRFAETAKETYQRLPDATAWIKAATATAAGGVPPDEAIDPAPVSAAFPRVIPDPVPGSPSAAGPEVIAGPPTANRIPSARVIL